jgi:hypothetical protein
MSRVILCERVDENMSVNWVGVEKIGKRRILDALSLALRGKPIPEISRETGIAAPSLYSVRDHGPYAHTSKKSGNMKCVDREEKASGPTPK